MVMKYYEDTRAHDIGSTVFVIDKMPRIGDSFVVNFKKRCTNSTLSGDII